MSYPKAEQGTEAPPPPYPTYGMPPSEAHQPKQVDPPPPASYHPPPPQQQHYGYSQQPPQGMFAAAHPPHSSANYGQNYGGQQPTVVMMQQCGFGRQPMNMTCPHCSKNIYTSVDFQISGGTWLICLIIFGIGFLITVFFLIGFFLWFVCCVPCCMNDCKDCIHTCPNCHAFLGKRGPKYLS